MRLDYQPKSQKFTLHVPPKDAEQLRIDHGLDISRPASTSHSTVLFTGEPYAAVAFLDWATPAAAHELNPIALQIAASWRMQPAKPNWPSYIAPQTVDTVPYPLQLADLEYALARQHTLVADEPGVGKTPTAIMYGNLLAFGRGRPGDFRALVICPASIRLQWAARIRQWSTIKNVQVRVVAPGWSGVPHTRDSGIHWTIMSYDAASTRTSYNAIVGQQCNYDLLVLDEAHYLKTPTTGRTRAIFGAADRGSSISDRAEQILALSGTPAPNRARETYPLIAKMCPEIIDYRSQRAFNERFNPRRTVETKEGKTYTQEGVGRSYELQARLRAGCMVRHLFADAFPQLKLPLYQPVYAETDAAVRRALAVERLLDIDPETFLGADAKIDGAVSTARLEMGRAIAPQAVKYLHMLNDGGEDKIVVFAWHREVLDILQKGLDRLGVVRVDGSSSEDAKGKAVIAFQKDPNVSFILGNLVSLGTGVDGLQNVARRLVIVEPDWVFGNNEQAVGRLYRGGQRAQVLADIFVAAGSLAERILAAALRKGKLIHSTLDAKVTV